MPGQAVRVGAEEAVDEEEQKNPHCLVAFSHLLYYEHNPLRQIPHTQLRMETEQSRRGIERISKGVYGDNVDPITDHQEPGPSPVPAEFVRAQVPPAVPSGRALSMQQRTLQKNSDQALAVLTFIFVGATILFLTKLGSAQP